MTDTERTLLPLLAACIWDAAPAIPDGMDWKAVVAEAGKQSVLGLITPALPAEMEDLGFAQHSLFLAYMHAQDELTALLQAGGRGSGRHHAGGHRHRHVSTASRPDQVHHLVP